MNDEKFMRLALEEAEKARRIFEVPVGCVITDHSGNILSRSHNQREKTNDPTSHAEIVAIRKASAKLNDWRLTGTTLYVTLEPCVMCMGAIVNSRIEKVVFGAKDPKAGALVSNYEIGFDGKLNHTIQFKASVLEDECSEILSLFFKDMRDREN